MLRALTLFLPFFLFLAGCPVGPSGSGGDDDDSDVTPPDDDDDDTPPMDDDDDDDDDATPEPGVLTLEPSDVTAGSIVDVFGGTENWAVDQQTVECCFEPEAVLLSVTGQSTAEGIPLRFFFGIEAEGTVPWGMENGSGAVQDNFEVTAIDTTALTAITSDAAQAITVDADGGHSIFTYAHAADGVFMARGTNIGSTSFHPQLMLVGDNGYEVLATAGFADPQAAEYGTPVLVWDLEAGDYYLHVTDADLASGADFTADVEVTTVEMGDPVDVPEVEPNNEAAEWQELGELGTGTWTLTGNAETAGHDADTQNLNGDQDVFTFVLAADSIVEMTLSWEGENEDFDAVVYDHSDGAALGFDSPDAINLQMASTDNPEEATMRLDGGTRYAVGVGNWEGTAEQDWTLTMTVLSQAWPE